LFQNRKKLIISLMSVLLVGMVGWFTLFKYSTQWLKTEVERATHDLKQKGYNIAYTDLTFQGHPLSIKATFHNPQVSDSLGSFNWKGQEINISMKPWNWYTLTVSLPHAQQISLPKHPSLSLETLSLEGGQGILKLTHQGQVDEISFFVNRLLFLSQNVPHPLFFQAFSLKATNVAKPLALRFSLTTEVKGMDAFLKEPPPLQPLVISLSAALGGFQGTTLPTSWNEWRDGGGVLDVSLLKFTWSPIAITAEGTLTFDKDMYPLGSFSSHIAGYQEALTRLVETGHIKKKNASMVSFVLDMMSRADAQGGKQLTVPITLQDRKVSVGAIPLWKLE
jgi:hypothetical protein